MKKWNKFWFEERSRESLCLLRIFYGIIFLFKLTGFHNLQFVDKLGFRFTNHLFATENTYYLNEFSNPVPGFEWLPVPSFTQYQTIEDILLICTVFFILGFFTRFFGIVIAITYTYLLLISQFSYHHHIMNFIVILLILGFSNCSDHYSLDSIISKKEKVKRKILPIRLIQVFISIVYFFSFIQKFNYSWLSGDMILVFLDQASIKGDFTDAVNSLFSYQTVSSYKELFWRSLGPFTVFSEALLSFGLWIPMLRRFTLLVGVLLHLGIDLTMGVGTFSLQMMVIYIAFITPESQMNTLLYNPGNSKHRVLVASGRLLDWLQRIKWKSHSEISSLVFFGPDNKYKQGSEMLFGVFSLTPVTFIPSFLIGIYLSVKNGLKNR